jgi:uncharacterized protein YcfJ
MHQECAFGNVLPATTVGGVIGGVLGNELSGGDTFATAASAIAGGVLGHELEHR